MGPDCSLWVLIGLYSSLCVLTVSNVSLWVFLGLNVSLWILMVLLAFHVFLCVLLGS